MSNSPTIPIVTRTAVALVLLLAPAYGTTATLRLADAFAQAAEHNLRVKIAAAAEVGARANVAAQSGRFDLHLTSGVEALERSFGGQSYGAQLRYQLGLSKLFATGTRVSVGGAGSAVWARPAAVQHLINPPWQTDPFYFPDPHAGALELTVEQPLLRGAGFAVNEAPVQAAEAQLRAAAIDRQRELAAQLRDVEIEYWSWAAAVRAVDIRRASADLARAQSRRTAELIRQGRQAPSDALLAEQIVADRRDALAVAESGAAERHQRLHYLMGLSYAEMSTAAATPEPFPKVDPTSEELNLILARARSNGYLPRRLREERAALEQEALLFDDAAWPDLVAATKLAVTGSDAKAGGAFRDAAAAGSHTWLAALRFAYPLGVNTAAAESERLRAELSQQRAALDDVVRATELAVAAAHREVRLALERIELAGVARRLAEQKLKAEEDRYNVGRTTMQNLRQFQEDLDEASLREVEARAAWLTARAQLDFLAGDLLSRRGMP